MRKFLDLSPAMQVEEGCTEIYKPKLKLGCKAKAGQVARRCVHVGNMMENRSRQASSLDVAASMGSSMQQCIYRVTSLFGTLCIQAHTLAVALLDEPK